MNYMKNFKRISTFLISILICISSAGCNTDTVLKKDYKIPDNLATVEDSLLAQNKDYELTFDSNVGCVMLYDKKKDTYWGTTPYEAYKANDDSLALNSILKIEYYDLSDNSMQNEMSYNCNFEGTVSYKKVDNGICITYYFSIAEVTIPVYLTLEDDGLSVKVKAEEIVESGKTKLISVSLAPNLCSTPNTQDKSTYLLIPTGSGALMYTDNEINKSSRDYSGEVFGTDAARMRLDVTANEEKINSPVFGAKNPDNSAIFAVIEKGAESARIDASAGNARYGYSNVCATFYVRGFDEIEQVIGTQNTDATALAEARSDTAEYKVKYYPLYDADSDYVGMAKFYRNYLKNKGLLKKSGLEQKNLQLEVIGGALINKFFLGVPYETVTSLTTINQAKDIVKEIAEKTDSGLNVLFNGFGTSGIDIGKVGGGFEFSSKLGNAKNYADIQKYCEDNGINLFNDYELVNYNKSGNGFSGYFDTAKTANLQRASSYPLKINTLMSDDSKEKVNILKRSMLDEAIDVLIKKTKNISGVGLGSLASTAYSDYSSESYYAKDGMANQVSQLVEKLKKNGKKVVLRSANSYCAGLADSVCDVSLKNGSYTVFDEEIPFYQVVFGGNVPLYSLPLNFSSDIRATLLKAIESGVSPSWCVLKTHSSSVSSSKDEFYYSMEYDYLKDEIFSIAEETKDYYSKISGSPISSHKIVADGVSKTAFENGVAVYVNHSNQKVSVSGNTIEAQSYVVGN